MADESPTPPSTPPNAQGNASDVSGGDNPGNDLKKNVLTALAGIGLFVGLGMLLSPGVAKVDRKGPKNASPVTTTSNFDSRRNAPHARAAAEDGDADTSLAAESFDCMIQPFDVVDIGSPINGRIASVRAERGDYVRQGHLLAQLESSVEAVAVQVARANATREGELESGAANVSLNEQRLERAVELYESDSLSLEVRQTVENEAKLANAELKRARENHAMAKLQLSQAEANLARRSIYSPVSGFVIERLMAPGEVVDEETILRVAQVDPLRVEVILPADLFGTVKAGDEAEIVPEAPLDEPRQGKIAIVDPVIDGASATFGAVMLLPNPQHDLPAGLRCRLTFGSDADSRNRGVARARESDENGDDSA